MLAQARMMASRSRSGVILSQKNTLGFIIQSESLSCTTVNNAHKVSSGKQGKLLHKIMSGSKKKFYNRDSPSWLEKPKLGTSEFLQPKAVKNPRRIAVLNSVLLEAITDLMANGDVNTEILGHGIEITRVKVSSEFNYVNVFWICTKDRDVASVAQLLDSKAALIRSHLCRTHVLGNVPYVKFVKDREQEKLAEVERLLSKADFGPDFTPRHPGLRSNAENSLKHNWPSLPLSDEGEASVPGEPGLSEAPFVGDFACTAEAEESGTSCRMRMDILGLDHVGMMHQVVKNMSRARAEHRKFPGEVDVEGVPQPRAPSAPAPSRPALVMSIKQYLGKQKRLKYMARKQETVDLRNAQLMEGEKVASVGQAEEEEPDDEGAYFDEEDYEMERRGDPPY